MKKKLQDFKYTFLLVLLLSFVLQTPVYAVIQQVGGVTNVEVREEAGQEKAVFSLGRQGQLAIIPYAEDLIRVRWHWDGIWPKEEVAIDKELSQWQTVEAKFYDNGNKYYIETDSLLVEVVKTPTVRVNFKDKKSNFYLSKGAGLEYDTAYNPLGDSSFDDIRHTGAMPQGFKLKQIRKFPHDEAIFGLGEYAGSLDRRGEELQCWASDTYGWNEDTNPMYMSLPFFYGVQDDSTLHPEFAYGIFFNNPARPAFKFGTEWQDKYSFQAGDGQIDYFFFGGGREHTMKNVLKSYTKLTGKPTMLPKWAYGHHLSRWSYDNQGWVDWLVDEFRSQDIPLDSIYLDLDYMDTIPDNQYRDNSLNQLQFNDNFPDPKGMINHAEANGVKLVPIMEAWLNPNDPLYQEADEQLHFIKNNDGSTALTNIYFGSTSWIDFTSGPAREWWKEKVVGFLNKYPFEGIWNDLNEPADVADGNSPIPLDGLFWLDGKYGDSNDSRRWMHNLRNTYANYETSLTYETLLEKNPNKRPFVLSRAGWPGIQKYALNWSGDNVANYDHLRHNIRLGMSVMMSGQVNFGHDIGGFVGHSEGELMTRWTEWGVLTPLFRNHSQKWDPEREPFRYEEPYKSHIIDNIKFRYKIMPYLYTLAYNSTQTGIPMNMPTVMNFMDDEKTYYQNDYDFMVGDSLLAAPVYNKGARSRKVYLPEGVDWYDWYNDRKYRGGDYREVDAPLGKLPLFVKEGAIIPMGPVMQHTNEYQPGYLDLHIWPSSSSSFTLYEDDGETWDYKSGEYAKTKIKSTKTKTEWQLKIDHLGGDYQTGRESYIIIGHDLRRPEKVSLNGIELTKYSSLESLHSNKEGYFYNSGTEQLKVKLPDNKNKSEIKVELSNQPNYESNYEQVFFRGTANEWGTKSMQHSGDYIWETTVNTKAQSRFKFDIYGDWKLNFGDDNGDGYLEQSGDDIYISAPGSYKIKFNGQRKQYTINKEEITGSAAISYSMKRGKLSEIVGVKMELKKNGEKYKEFSLQETGTLIEDLSAGDYEINFVYTTASYEYRGQVSFQINTDGQKIEKRMSITKEESTNYQSSYERVYLRGTFNNWAIDEMELVDDYIWEQRVEISGNDRFKLDIYGDWSLNFGDDNKDGYVEKNGADIYIYEAGTYQIRFNDAEKKYLIKKL